MPANEALRLPLCQDHGDRRAIGNCANVASRSAKRGIPTHRPTGQGDCRRHPPWPWRYQCATSRTWGCRALLHGRNSIHRTAGYATRSRGGVEGRGCEAASYPDWASINCGEEQMTCTRTFLIFGLVFTIIAQATPDCNSPQNTPEMRDCAGLDLKKADDELNAVYGKLLKTLDPEG